MKTWLCQIAKNTYYHSVRQIVKQEKLAIKAYKEETQESFTESVENRQMYLHLKSVIETLEEKPRNVVEYRLYCELSFKEIGYLLGIREATAKVIFSRAKVRIQKQLREGYGYEI